MRRKIALAALCCVLLMGTAASIYTACCPPKKVTAYFRDHPGEYEENLTEAAEDKSMGIKEANNDYYNESHETDVPGTLVTLLGIGMATSFGAFVVLISGGLVFTKKGA